MAKYMRSQQNNTYFCSKEHLGLYFMQLIKYLLCFAIMPFYSALAQTDTIRVALFYSNPLQVITLSALEGNYKLQAGSTIAIDVKPSDIFYIRSIGDSLELSNPSFTFGHFACIAFEDASNNAAFRLNPVLPAGDGRNYYSSLKITSKYKKLQLINRVETEKYLAGVVQAESGSKATLEYYKTQAVICRTYLYSHIDRHNAEGFNVCDEVHCQVYRGRCDQNPLIEKGTQATRGIVIIDHDSTLITAAFHSNCGGETENAERVWIISKPYLKKVKDPYCANQRSSSWQKTVNLTEWTNYFSNQGIHNLGNASFNFTQTYRKAYYKIGNDSVPLKKIRDDWKLRSTFFSTKTEGNKLIITGRGYGHAIGLCQEGAMQMALQGKMFEEIIRFYYRDVTVINIQSLRKKL